jgi:hypothetical protein
MAYPGAWPGWVATAPEKLARPTFYSQIPPGAWRVRQGYFWKLNSKSPSIMVKIKDLTAWGGALGCKFWVACRTATSLLVDNKYYIYLHDTESQRSRIPRGSRKRAVEETFILLRSLPGLP